MKKLTQSNCLVRKVGTHFTNLVHRLILRQIKPQFVVNGLDEVDPSRFEVVSNIVQHEKEPFLFDTFIETSLEISPKPDKKQVQFDKSPSEAIYQAAESRKSVRIENNFPLCNIEFIVEGQLTSEQKYTAPSVIDTSKYKLGH